MTITGSSTETNNLRMENTADVLTAGSAADDKLSVTKSAVLGGILIDLTSTTDQITTFNGSANAAIQKGFEDVDLTGTQIAGGYEGSLGDMAFWRAEGSYQMWEDISASGSEANASDDSTKNKIEAEIGSVTGSLSIGMKF